MLFRVSVFLLIFCGDFFSVTAQVLSPRSIAARDKVGLYLSASQSDSAQIVVSDFLSAKDLTAGENFYANFLFCRIVSVAKDAKEAIPLLLRTKVYVPADKDSSIYLSLLYGEVAECYFTTQVYDSALYYAMTSIATSPNASLRSNGHAANYMIVGYAEFIDREYTSAIEHYNLAMTEYRKSGDLCELPLCYMKIARVWNASGNTVLAENNIQRALDISDSCGIEQYTLLSKRTLFDIYNENKNYEAALSQLLEINTLVGKMESKKQSRQLDEIIVKYETELVHKENENLREINSRNAEILSKQDQQVFGLIIALVILFVLLLLLFRNFVKRKKVESTLAELNTDLERQVADRTKHITEANREIRVNTDTLIFQNKQLVDFCNIISHNLRSPMRNITTLLEFVDNAKDENEKQEILSKLRPVVQSMNTTFDELVESLQVKQDLEIKLDEIQLDDCFKRTIQELELEIESASATVSSNFSQAPQVKYPNKYLVSIFHNLISNALKYRSPDRLPVISVESHWEDDSIILTVTDNGLGIDLDANGDKLFKIGKVFHLHRDAKGFGLFITRTQVEAMRGKITAESKVGIGSRFIVTFANQR